MHEVCEFGIGVRSMRNRQAWGFRPVRLQIAQEAEKGLRYQAPSDKLYSASVATKENTLKRRSQSGAVVHSIESTAWS